MCPEIHDPDSWAVIAYFILVASGTIFSLSQRRRGAHSSRPLTWVGACAESARKCRLRHLSSGIQQPLNPLRLASNDLQISLGWPVRSRAPLLPVSKRAKRDMVTDGKFLLRQCQSASNDFSLRRSLHPAKIFSSQRPRVAVGTGCCLDGRGRHGLKRFAGSSRFAHFG